MPQVGARCLIGCIGPRPSELRSWRPEGRATNVCVRAWAEGRSGSSPGAAGVTTLMARARLHRAHLSSLSRSTHVGPRCSYLANPEGSDRSRTLGTTGGATGGRPCRERPELVRGARGQGSQAGHERQRPCSMSLVEGRSMSSLVPASGRGCKQVRGQQSLFGGPERSGAKPMRADELEVLITVKAAPNPSEKSGETVCVAGLALSEGRTRARWVRLYPVNFRFLEADLSSGSTTLSASVPDPRSAIPEWSPGGRTSGHSWWRSTSHLGSSAGNCWTPWPLMTCVS